MPKWVNRWLLTALCDNSNYLLTCTLSVTHGSSTVVCPHYSTMSLISWTCQKELPISWPSWCIVVCTVTHLVTSLTISPQPLTSLSNSVSIPQTDNFSYPAAKLTRTAVGILQLLVRLSGTHYPTNSKIRRADLSFNPNHIPKPIPNHNLTQYARWGIFSYGRKWPTPSAIVLPWMVKSIRSKYICLSISV